MSYNNSYQLSSPLVMIMMITVYYGIVSFSRKNDNCMNDNLLEVKRLFGKLEGASAYCQKHQRTETVNALIDKYKKELVSLGVWEQIVDAVFVFGISADKALEGWVSSCSLVERPSLVKKVDSLTEHQMSIC